VAWIAISNLLHLLLTAVGKSHPIPKVMAVNESCQSPISIKRSAMVCFRLFGYTAPEEPWCGFAFKEVRRFVAACFPVQTPGELGLHAIR